MLRLHAQGRKPAAIAQAHHLELGGAEELQRLGVVRMRELRTMGSCEGILLCDELWRESSGS